MLLRAGKRAQIRYSIFTIEPLLDAAVQVRLAFVQRASLNNLFSLYSIKLGKKVGALAVL